MPAHTKVVSLPSSTHANVHILFTVALSNHHHTGIHDPDGNFPLFIEYFHGLLARCQNAHLGRFEGFWSSEPTSVVRLVEPNDILDKMAYAFTNPAAADLVGRAPPVAEVSCVSFRKTGPESCLGITPGRGIAKVYWMDISRLPTKA